MTTQQQAYINGFVKKASEYGFNENEAIDILKQATVADAPAYSQDPSMLQGLKNFGVNAARLPKALYSGLMGRNSAVNHPASVPFVTGGSKGSEGIGGGLIDRAVNYGRHVDRSIEQNPVLSAAGALLGSRLGEKYVDSQPEHRNSNLARGAGTYIGANVIGRGLPLAKQQLSAMWNTPPSK
jgi:hypothetical protein